MSLDTYLGRIQRLHDLISMGATGSREELAKKLDISVSTLQDTLKYMKEYMDAPIIYNKLRKTYLYKYKGCFLDFTFKARMLDQKIIDDLKEVIKRVECNGL